MRYNDERCEHHQVIPIVDATCSAAFVFQKPCLKWAEEEDAYHVAYAIDQCYDQHHTFIYDVGEIQNEYESIQCYPDSRGGYQAPFGAMNGVGISAGSIIDTELLLTTHAFNVRWKETQNHLNGEEPAQYCEKPWTTYVVDVNV